MPTLTDYSVGDLVVLGHDGVARIEDISSVDTRLASSHDAQADGAQCSV